MDKDEALKLALEALESERDKYLDWGDEDGAPDDVYEAITAIKQVLAAPVQEPVAWVTGLHAGRCVIKTINPAAILPVGIALYTTPPAAPVQDLPFGVGGGLVAIKTLLSRDPCVHANTAIEMIDAILKEHPAAQRQWVGLTDEERLEAAEIDGADEWFWKVCKAIEAKLKEKNT
jgi:hypothetical protein